MQNTFKAIGSHRVFSITCSSISLSFDKYDLRSSLGAWPDLWVKNHTDKFDQGRNGDFFVAYAFKLDAAFAKITRRLILSSRISGNEKLVNVFDQVIGEFAPTQVQGKLLFCVKTICTLRISRSDGIHPHGGNHRN